MSHRQIVLYLVNIPFELVLCGLVYGRRVHQRLPLFAAYATVFLTCTLCFGLIYHHFGYHSSTTYYAGWIISGVNLFGRCLAIAEFCRYSLQEYKGIWALSWRILGFLAALFLANSAIDSWGQPDWIATYVLTIERDIGISAAILLLVILLISAYYGVWLEPVQKGIALGLFVLCVVDAVNDTVLRTIFTQWIFSWSHMRLRVEEVNDWWNTIRTSAFVVSMSIWCFALWKPLTAPNQEPELLPAEIYAEVSPAVNLRLRAINDRLLELLKP
jgi:hypothetical protein